MTRTFVKRLLPCQFPPIVTLVPIQSPPTQKSEQSKISLSRTVEITSRCVANQITKSITTPRRRTSFCAIRYGPSQKNFLTFSGGHKIVWPHFFTEHDVIVQVNPMSYTVRKLRNKKTCLDRPGMWCKLVSIAGDEKVGKWDLFWNISLCGTTVSFGCSMFNQLGICPFVTR